MSLLSKFPRFDNPASVAEFPVRHLTYNYLIAMNSWLLLFPCDLCCDWTMNTVPLIEGWGDPRNFATISTFAVLFLLAKAALSRGSDRHSNIVIMVLFDFSFLISFLRGDSLSNKLVEKEEEDVFSLRRENNGTNRVGIELLARSSPYSYSKRTRE